VIEQFPPPLEHDDGRVLPLLRPAILLIVDSRGRARVSPGSRELAGSHRVGTGRRRGRGVALRRGRGALARPSSARGGRAASRF